MKRNELVDSHSCKENGHHLQIHGKSIEHRKNGPQLQQGVSEFSSLRAVISLQTVIGRVLCFHASYPISEILMLGAMGAIGEQLGYSSNHDAGGLHILTALALPRETKSPLNIYFFIFQGNMLLQAVVYTLVTRNFMGANNSKYKFDCSTRTLTSLQKCNIGRFPLWIHPREPFWGVRTTSKFYLPCQIRHVSDIRHPLDLCQDLLCMTVTTCSPERRAHSDRKVICPRIFCDLNIDLNLSDSSQIT